MKFTNLKSKIEYFNNKCANSFIYFITICTEDFVVVEYFVRVVYMQCFQGLAEIALPTIRFLTPNVSVFFTAEVLKC